MMIQPIRNEDDYRSILHQLSSMFDDPPAPGTAVGDRFDVLVTLVEAYESKHFPIDLPDAVEAIKFRMEQAGLTAKDLVPAIGKLNRVYEVLNRKRRLTLPMVWRLHTMFAIPTDSLVRPPKAA